MNLDDLVSKRISLREVNDGLRGAQGWLTQPGRRHILLMEMARTGGVMAALTETNAIKTISTHYIDGAFVASHGQEVMDIIRPTDAKVIGRVTLGDEEDTRRAITAARRAFDGFGRTTKEDRADTLRGCIGPSRRASMTSPPRWSKNAEA
jgi:hypothetical protein